MTATFMTEGIVAATLGKDLELVILDHRIGEEVVTDLVELLLISSIDLDLDRLADADRADSLEAQVIHGAACGHSGRVKDGGFRHNGNDGFHKEWKIGLKRRRDKMKIDEKQLTQTSGMKEMQPAKGMSRLE
jgi:hypothetical protein